MASTSSISTTTASTTPGSSNTAGNTDTSSDTTTSTVTHANIISNTITNSPTSSSNSNTTSSSDKTKLSTSSTTVLNESPNLKNSTSEQVPSTDTLIKSPAATSDIIQHNRSGKDGDADVLIDGENVEHIDDSSDVDTLTLGLETESKCVSSGGRGRNHKNQMHPDHKNDHDEELNEFSSSLSISTLSTASSSGGDIFLKNSKPSSNMGNTITTTIASTTNATIMNANTNSPNNNPTSTSSRKREHNRRKSSDPVSVKKLPRLLESDDDSHNDLDDDEELIDEDYDILDEHDEDEEEDDPQDFNFNLRRNNIRRKHARSILFNSNNIESNTALSSTTSKPSSRSGGGQRSIRSNPYHHDLISAEATTAAGRDASSSEEKLINSSNEEYETSITQSELIDSHYNIRWKNHQTHILLAFESLLQNETFCDVTLICDDYEDNEDRGDNEKNSNGCNNDQNTLKGSGDGKEGLLKLRAHKIVLSACSEYFQRIFAENPCKHPVIVLKDYQAWEIQALLDFMYRGEVDVSLERLSSLVKSAESLQIRGLTDSLGKLGPDLFKQNPSYLPKSINNNISNNNNNKSKIQTHKSFADNSSGRNRKSDEQDQNRFLSLNRLDTGALNLSMDLNVKINPNQKRPSLELELPMRNNNMTKTSINNKISTNANNIKNKPQTLNLNLVETSMLQIHKDKDSYPTTTRSNSGTRSGTGGSGTKTTTTNHHNVRHHYHHLNHHNHNHHLLPEDQEQNSCNDEEGEINQNNPEDFHNLSGARQNLLPRRKQARPRRRSGDYIAQDLRKVMSSLNQGNPLHNLNQQTFDLLNLQNLRAQEEEENRGKLEIRLSREDLDSPYQLHQQEQSPHRDNPLHLHYHNQNLHNHPEDPDQDEGSPTSRRSGGTVMTRLAQRRRSSRRHNQDRDSRDLNTTSPMNLRNANKRSNGSGNNNQNNMEEDHNGMETGSGERIIDEEEFHRQQNRVLDYTTRTSSPVGGNKKLKTRGITQGLHFPGQGHLPFLRNWSPTLGNNPTPPLGHQRISPMKHEGDSDDGISSTADQCSSPPLSPTMDPKHFLARHMNNHTSPHDFPLFGIHPDHPRNIQRSNLVGSLQFNKQSPPSPSNFFLGPLGSMSITPIGGGGGTAGDRDRDDSRAGTPSTPPNVFSPAGFPMQLPMALTSGNNHGGHQIHMNNHNLHGGKEDRDVERGSRGGKDGTRGSPVGWPGLPLGPPPIFGRHRAQHSAPRGGPPRAWSNADLTEALHNVWNKKMTTSQASRIFGIPYNSLLMYVRGKYGKSLKLDLLKKGLDQAMENSQNSANNINSNTNATSPPGNSSPASTTNNSNSNSNTNNNPSTNTNSTTSPITHNNLGVSITTTNPHNNTNNSSSSNNSNNNNISSSNSSSSVKGHSNSNHLLSNLSSEHNNNNNPTTGMGHLHLHLQNLHNQHQQQQQQQHKSSKSHDRAGLELPHELPPGFNPFTAASIFGEYPSPFPFASALSHILPQANLVNQHGVLGHPGLGLSLSHSTRNDKVSVGDEDK